MPGLSWLPDLLPRRTSSFSPTCAQDVAIQEQGMGHKRGPSRPPPGPPHHASQSLAPNLGPAGAAGAGAGSVSGPPPAQSPVCDEFARPHHHSRSRCLPFPATKAAGRGSQCSLSRAAPSFALVPGRTPLALPGGRQHRPGTGALLPTRGGAPGGPAPLQFPSRACICPSALHLCLENNRLAFL